MVVATPTPLFWRIFSSKTRVLDLAVIVIVIVIMIMIKSPIICGVMKNPSGVNWE